MKEKRCPRQGRWCSELDSRVGMIKDEKLQHISLWCLCFIMQGVQTEQALSSMTIILRGKLWCYSRSCSSRRDKEEEEKERKLTWERITDRLGQQTSRKRQRNGKVSVRRWSRVQENKGCISALFCCSSCDAGQCSATEPVMSLMQHATKVILHKPPLNTSRHHTAHGQ